MSATRPSTLIPGEARARFNIRFNDKHTLDSLKALIEQRAAKAAGGKIRFAFKWEPSNAGVFVTKPGPFTELVANAVAEVTGRKPELSTTGGTSDARFITAYCPVVEFGLVGQTMHQVDERVPIADLRALTTIYRTIIDKYFRAKNLMPASSAVGVNSLASTKRRASGVAAVARFERQADVRRSRPPDIDGFRQYQRAAGTNRCRNGPPTRHSVRSPALERREHPIPTGENWPGTAAARTAVASRLPFDRRRAMTASSRDAPGFPLESEIGAAVTHAVEIAAA